MATDPSKVEALKVWYAMFCTIMDANEGESWKIGKLATLRNRIKAEAPELETN